MLSFLLPRTCFVGAMLIAVTAIADTSAPSQEFWEYMAEFGDDNGDILDPLEYDQIIGMKDGDLGQLRNTTDDAAKEKASSNKPKAGNTDMKLEQKSSLQNSSASAKGAGL